MTAPRHFAHGVYRPDVDGLRCIAVLGVIFCHLKFSAIPGVFVGVDVFFVISGYLISRNILNDLQDGRFSLLTFYERRIRRIFPALFVTIAASFAVGLVLWSPDCDGRRASGRACRRLFGEFLTGHTGKERWR